MMVFAVTPNEDKKTLSGCNDVASLKAWVVHGPLVCDFGVLLVGLERIRRPGYVRSRRIPQTRGGRPDRVAAAAQP